MTLGINLAIEAYGNEMVIIANWKILVYNKLIFIQKSEIEMRYGKC